MHLEAEATGLVAANALLGKQSRINLEEHAVERSAEVSAVDRSMTGRLGVVDVLALGAVQANSALVGNVVLAHRQEGVSVTHDTGAFAEIAALVLLDLDCLSEIPSHTIHKPPSVRHTILARPRVVTMYLAWTRP